MVLRGLPKYVSSVVPAFIFLKKSLLLAIFVLSARPGSADTPDTRIIHQRGTIHTRVLETTDAALDAWQLSRPEHDDEFAPITVRKSLSPRKFYWYKLDFHDITLTGSGPWTVRFLPYDHIHLYHKKGDSLGLMINGRMERSRSRLPTFAIDFEISEDDLIDGRFLLARIQHVYRKNVVSPASWLHPLAAELDKTYYTKKDLINYAPYILFIGGMLLMILYSFGIYFMNRDKLFNYYAIYLLTLVLYLGVRMPLIFGPLEVRFPMAMHLYNELIQVIVNVCYLLFASIFLNARRDFPGLHKAISWAIRFLIFIMALQVLLIFSMRYGWMETYVIQAERYFMITFSLIAYFHILLTYKKKVVLFLLTGSLFFLAGGVLAMFLHHIKYMMLGAAIEVFIFSLGMGYRIKVVEQNRRIIENDMNKLRLTALQAQMNPHFIFNSLNSVRAYIISNETKSASDFLNKFARLIRLILHYSSKDTISLKEELEAITLYVELEQMRYRENFGFILKVDEGMDTKNFLIPPLILQPYIENAIIHGLAPKSGEKELMVEILRCGPVLCCTIRDNGVGRMYSNHARSKIQPQHKPVAMELTRKRLELSENGNQGSGNIEINDLMQEGQPAGTEVRLKLPVKTVT